MDHHGHHGHHHKHHGHHGHKDHSNQKGIHFQPINGQLYKIVSVKDISKSFTIQSTGNHQVVLDEYKGNDNQNFHIYKQGNHYAFVAVIANAGLCIQGDSNANSAHLLGDPQKHSSSLFELVPAQGIWAGKGWHFKTASNKTVDLNAGNTSNGTAIIQWDYHGGDNQTWLITPAQQHQQQGFNVPIINPNIINNQGFNQQSHQQNQGFNIPVVNPYIINNQGVGQQTHQQGFNQNNQFTPVAGQHYKIVSITNPTFGLNKSGNFKYSNTLILWTYGGAANQKWTFENVNGKYKIRNLHDGSCLRVTNEAQQDNIWLRCDQINNFASHLWEIIPAEGQYAGKGYVHFKSFANKALTLPDNKHVNEAIFVQQAYNGSAGQTWHIVPV